MADRPTDPVADPAIDPRVESFLHAELAKAERDFSRSQATPVPRARARSGLLAALAVATTAVVLVVVVGGPRLMGVAATPPPSGPIGSGPSAPATVDPAATPDPETVVRFDGASLSADGMTLTLDFTGSKEYEPGNPCTNDYAGWTEMVDGMLHAAVVDITPPPTDPPAYECTAEGYGRTVSITLPEPFTGDRVVDLADGVTKFAREPADLVVLQGLTEAWSLQSSESVDSDGTPLWRQVYATSSATEGSGVGRLELTQGFGGAVGVSGGDTDAEVVVGGHPGVLYRTPWYGELVLVWMLGDYGLAIVANDADFTPDELVALAETAIVPPHSRPSAVPSGRPSPSPTPSSSPTLTPAATPGSPGLATSPPEGYKVWFDTFSLSADGLTLTLGFTGGAKYSPDNPCSYKYTGWAEADGDTLYAAVVDTTPPRERGATPVACNDIGYGRSVKVRLAAPFTGARLVDLARYVHFLRAPDGLAELQGLPADWRLRESGDVEMSDAGRWVRTYSPHARVPEGTSKGRLDVYQSFGGSVNVSGGEIQTTVVVNGEETLLYSSSGYDELVLVWRLGGVGLALVADKTDFSVDELIALAESAAIPGGRDWGPLAVIGPQDGADTARTEGTLSVTGDCVHILEQGEPVLLVWPSDQTSWDPGTRAITFANADGTTVTVGDGSTVVLGGSGMSREEDGELVDTWLAGMRWVAPPAPGCAASTYWTVGAVMPG